MKRRYLNRKRNLAAAIALVSAVQLGIIGLTGYVGALREYAPVHVAVPADFFTGLMFGYGFGLFLYYLGRLRWGSEQFYE